jgi:dolichol-phosphate mannosyltransferase
MKMISVVIPLYKCSKSIEELTNRLTLILSNLEDSHQIIYVNDSSPEDDWSVVKYLVKINTNIVGISLARNFGQQNAITAGLSYAKGDYIIVMDGDLQDKPEDIKILYSKIKEGYDYVLVRRVQKEFSMVKKTSSYLFFKVFGYLANTNHDSSIGNFGIYQKKVIKAYLKLGDFYRSFPIMIKWVGFKSTTIDIKHGQRKHGKSSYSISKLFSLAFNSIVAHSNKLLYLSINFSIILITLSLLFAGYIVITYFLGAVTVPGYSSLIVAITFFTGCIMMVLGILGVYIGKMFDTVKGRPSYIIDEVIKSD